MSGSTPSTGPDSGGHAREVHVVAGVIRNERGEVLIARRRPGTHLGGRWEFPGGKVEPDETPLDALRRELDEELGIVVSGVSPLITVSHRYPDKRVRLAFWRVESFRGDPVGREGQEVAWAAPQALDGYAFPEADRAVLKAIRLPHRYLITPEPDRDQDRFLESLSVALDQGHTLVQFRARTLKGSAYRSLARRVVDLCASRGARLLINGAPDLSADVGAHGVHLNGARLHDDRMRPGAGSGLLGVSCHSPVDLSRAQGIDADFAVLSPVRPTKSHPGAEPLGWERFGRWVAAAALPVFALGGLTAGDLVRARAAGAQGVAAIRGYWPEGSSSFEGMGGRRPPHRLNG